MEIPDRASQFEKAVVGLRTLVLAGEFPENKRLSEVALAKRLGVSRTPLRQAMARLVDEGVLTQIATGGCRVSAFTMTDINDAIEIRGVMEGTAARLAAERGIPDTTRIQGHQILDRIDRALASDPIDFDTYVLANAEFHSLIANAAGSTMIARELDRANRLPLASPSAFLNGQEQVPDFQMSLHRAQHQHRAIFEAILDREGARAEALSREHARLARKNLEYVVAKKADFTELVPGLALVTP